MQGFATGAQKKPAGRKLLTAVIALACAGFSTIVAASRVLSAEFVPVRVASENLGLPGTCEFRLEGEIFPGDLKKMPRKPEGLCLNSPGGNFSEGLSIAKYIMDSGIPTVLEPGSECLSACAFIFLAGSIKGSNAWQPARQMHAKSKLGFHAPFINPAWLPSKGLKPEDVVEAHRAARKSTHKLIDLFVRSSYAAGVSKNVLWVPPSLIRAALEQGPSDFFYVDTIGKVGNFRIDLEGMPLTKRNDVKDYSNLCRNIYLWSNDIFTAKKDAVYTPMVDGKLLDALLNNSQAPEVSPYYDGWVDVVKKLTKSKSLFLVYRILAGHSVSPVCLVQLSGSGEMQECGVSLIDWHGGDPQNFCPPIWSKHPVNKKIGLD